MLRDVRLVQQAVEDGDGERLVAGEEFGPVADCLVGRDRIEPLRAIRWRIGLAKLVLQLYVRGLDEAAVLVRLLFDVSLELVGR